MTKEMLAKERKVISVSQIHDGLGRDWVVKVIVVHKNGVRTWKNAKGTGRVFNFELVDSHNANREEFVESEAIQCTVFGDKAAKLYKLLQSETVYYISRGLIKPTKFNNGRVKHPFCLHVEDGCRIDNAFGENIESPTTAAPVTNDA